MNINRIKCLIETYKHEIKLRLVSKVACLPEAWSVTWVQLRVGREMALIRIDEL